MFVPFLVATMPVGSVHAAIVTHSAAPSLSDVAQVASVAEALGQVYKAAAGKQTSATQAVAAETAKFREALGKELAAEHVQSDGPCGKCARDFSSPCPAEWMNAGGSCHAPSLYKGPCGIVAYTSEMEIGDKVEFQNRCAVCWPCASASSTALHSSVLSFASTKEGVSPPYPIVNIIAEPPMASPTREAVGFLSSQKRVHATAPRDDVRPKAVAFGLAPGSEPGGLYERRTQSPLVWLNLLKSQFPETGKLWSDTSYEADAAQTLGKLKQEIEDLQR